MDEAMQGLLLQQARMGDQSAIHELYTETRDGAYYAVKRYIGNENDIAGILKETYIIAFGRLGEVPPGKNFTGWLHYVLAIKSVNYLRGRKVRLDSGEEFSGFPDERDLFPAAWLEQEQRRADVIRVIDGLPDGQRLAVTLHYLGGLALPEIAQCMGINEGAAAVHLQLGKNALRSADAEETAGQTPVLSRLFQTEQSLMTIPPEVSKAVYQEMMLFFMGGGKAPKLTVAAASASGGGGKGKGFLPWLITFVVVALAIVFLFWNFQRQQKAIGQQLVDQYEQSKAATQAAEAEYQSAAGEAEPPPPPQSESTSELPQEGDADGSAEEDGDPAAPNEDVPPVESQPGGDSPGGELVEIAD